MERIGLGFVIERVSNAMMKAGGNELKKVIDEKGDDMRMTSTDLTALVGTTGCVTLSKIVKNCAEAEGVPYKDLLRNFLEAIKIQNEL